MRFRFCGDADCPDWLLMQINSISDLSVDALDTLCKNVANSLLDKEFNYDNVGRLTSNVLPELSDVKACISAVNLILRSSACHKVASTELSAELEQLGLDRSHSTVISRVYEQHIQLLIEKFRQESLRLGRVNNVNVTEEGELFKVEMIFSDEKSNERQLKTFFMTLPQLKSFVSDLKKVKSRMVEIQEKPAA